MLLTHLSLSNFRNFSRLDVDIPSGTLLLVGNNAQGKTSALEAISYLASLTSFQAESDREVVNFIEGRKTLAVARIVANYRRKNRGHRLEIRLIQEQNKLGIARVRKEILLDGAKKKVAEAVGHFNAILFLPRMLQVIEGSPRERRRYLNLILSQAIPGYAANLNDYTKILGQRNALLKQLNEQGGDTDQLDFWDERISLRGAKIIHDRIHAFQALDRFSGQIHLDLTDTAEVLRINYLPSYDPLPQPDGQPALLNNLQTQP